MNNRTLLNQQYCLLISSILPCYRLNKALPLLPYFFVYHLIKFSKIYCYCQLIAGINHFSTSPSALSSVQPLTKNARLNGRLLMHKISRGRNNRFLNLLSLDSNEFWHLFAHQLIEACKIVLLDLFQLRDSLEFDLRLCGDAQFQMQNYGNNSGSQSWFSDFSR